MQATSFAYEQGDEMPNSAESERAILGAIILTNDVAKDAIERLRLDDFYTPSHQRIFAAMAALQKRGSEINPILIGEELKKDHALESVGGISFIANLSYGLPHSTNISHYAAHLRDTAARRRGMRMCAALTARCSDLSTPWTESVEWARRQTVDLETAKESSLIQSWKEVRGLDLPHGDQVVHELERSELGMINSVAGVGKSTLIRNLILSLASGRPFANIAPWRKPRRVVLLDFETRLRRLRKDINKMLEAFSSEERALIDENFHVICDRLVNDEPLSLSTAEHMACVVRDVRSFRADIVVVDTISAAFAVQEENSNSEVMRVILKPLGRLARETQSAVLGAHHVGKSGTEEGRGEKVYRGRGASAFGTFPSLVLNLTADSTDRHRVTLSMPKCKGREVDDFNLQLDRDARWFAITDQPVITARTSYDLTLGIFDDGKPRERREINELLTGQVSISGITNHLKTAVARGQLESPRRGRYQRPGEMLVMPAPIETSKHSIRKDEENGRSHTMPL